MVNLFEKKTGDYSHDEIEMNETDIFVDSGELRPRRRRVSRFVEEPEDYEEELTKSESNDRDVLPVPLKKPVRQKESQRLRKDMNLFEDLEVSDEIPEDLNEVKKEEVVLDAMKTYKEIQRRLKESRTSKEFYEVGRSQGRVEGMIEGFILACMNNGVDLEVISKKLVLTFNLDKKDAEAYLRSFYETRNIDFEEVSYE